MIKIVIGGQIAKHDIANYIKSKGIENLNVEVKNDIQAANDVKIGNADYYLGACETGGGGALSMAMALLGRNNCATISMPGRPPKLENVKKEFISGKKAFGFTSSHYKEAVDMVLKCIKEENE